MEMYGIYEKRHNEELYNLYEKPNILTYVRCKRLEWLGRVESWWRFIKECFDRKNKEKTSTW